MSAYGYGGTAHLIGMAASPIHRSANELERACRLIEHAVTPARHPTDDPHPAAFAPYLLCGTAQHALAADALLDIGVTAVLNCAPQAAHDCQALYAERDIAYCALDGCEDIAGYDVLGLHLAKATSFIREQLDSKRPRGRVLVHCFAGSNRSATIAIAYLLCTSRKPLLSLVESCFAQRPFILKNHTFRQQLVELCFREGIPVEQPRLEACPSALGTDAVGSDAPIEADRPVGSTQVPVMSAARPGTEAMGLARSCPNLEPQDQSAPSYPKGDFLQPYTLAEKLGQGAFATVYSCQLVGVEEPLAAKVVLRNKWVWINGRSTSASVGVNLVHKEVLALERVGRHPNIVRLIGLRSEPDREVLFLGRAAGGDLARVALSQASGMEEGLVRSYMHNLLSALAHCHRKKVVHRDVKLENVLLDSHGRAVLSDFGNAALIDEGQGPCNCSPAILHDKCGTKPWCAPEIISCGEEGYYGPPVDLWSAGICMFAMLSSRMPFVIADAAVDPRFARAVEVQARGRSTCAMLLHWLRSSDTQICWCEAAANLLDALLSINPNDRISADDALASAWLKQTGSKVGESLLSECVRPSETGATTGTQKRSGSVHNEGPRKSVRSSSYLLNEDVEQAHEERTCIWRGLRTETRADVLRGAIGTHHATHHPVRHPNCAIGRNLTYDVPMSTWLREENAYGAILPAIVIEADRPFKVGSDNNNNYRWGTEASMVQPGDILNGGYPR